MGWEERRLQELDEKRKRFYNAMSDIIQDDKDGNYDSIVKENIKRNVVDLDGNLSKEMLADLKQFKHEVLLNLEENLKNTRLPTEDIFGIKRRFCQVCESACNGYEPSTLIVPQNGEFPTFCKNCKCPAHFHQIVGLDDVVFPEEFRDTVKNHNITAKDLNFNCVMMAFQIRDQQQKVQNTTELMAIMKEEGLEIISIESRHLEIEEAIFMKSRMVSQTENIVLANLNQYFTSKAHGTNKVNEIRRDGAHGSAFVAKSGSHDAFLLNRHADKKEARIIKMSTQLHNENKHIEHIAGVQTASSNNFNTKRALTEKNLHANVMDTINQRVGINDKPEPSIARTSVVDIDQSLEAIQDTISMIRREPIVPAQRDKSFKVKSHLKHKTQIKKKLAHFHHQELTEEEQEVILTQQIEKDPLLHELITKEVIIMAISSTTYQNFADQIKRQVMRKIQAFLPPHEMPLLYISESKVISMEDCMVFFPALFRLTKSIVVSEPASNAIITSGRAAGQDVTTDLQIAIRGRNPDLMAKVQTLMNETAGGVLDDDDAENDINFKNNSTLRVKTSKRLKELLLKREKLRQTQAIDQTPNEEEDEWVRRAKETKKKQKLLSAQNKLLYNFGVLQDFFNYSAMSIQQSMHDIDIANPPKENPQDGALYALKNEVQGKQNIFAIAKIGLPNLILPCSLDIKLQNFNTYTQYLHLADSFFPSLSQSEHSLLIVRPLIVKNGLNDILVKMLKLNDFTILKRKIRMLTKAEVVFMAEQERITDPSKCELYYNLMMDGECEIVAVTKLGAVSDLKTIADGAAPYGRRRIAQMDEDTSAVRSNVDAVNSMFEITPFTSMSEFFDLEDFIVSHSKLDKYKKSTQGGPPGGSVNRIHEQLYLQKIEHIRRELNLFSRYFNLVAHVPRDSMNAQKELCVLMPEVAIIEEVIIMLNPIYAVYVDSAERLLSRMGFKVLCKKSILLSEDDSANLFKEKLFLGQNFDPTAKAKEQDHSSFTNGEKLSRFLSGSTVTIWHLTKLAGDREVRAMFHERQVELEDIFSVKVKFTPFKPTHFPYIFLFMDSPYMFEAAFNLLWGQRISDITGQLLVDGMEFNQRKQVLEFALQVTVGDTIKELSFDRNGDIIGPPKEGEAPQQIVTKLPQAFQLYGNPKGSTSVHTLVESESHGLYEIRFARLPHKGDFYNLSVEPQKLNIDRLKNRYFTKFHALNHYYNEVNKYIYNVCPAFYRFKISPLIAEGKPGSELLNRVFEVEEYMGRPFMEGLGNMFQDHIKMLKSTLGRTPQGIGRSIQQLLLQTEQKGLPPYLWGQKLAKMCHELQQIKGSPMVKGAGRLIYEKNHLSGEIRTDYYQADKMRYMRCLEDFKLGWGYYLSALECELIESKLMKVLESQTFKHTRTASKMMALIPDRISEINLRISEKLQLLVEDALKKDSSKQFYQHLLDDTLNPHMEEHTVNLVQSIMHTLHVENTKVGQKQRRFKDNNAGRGFKLEDMDREFAEEKKAEKSYSVHKACAVVGVEVARRPKYQLIASVMYLFNFYFRKIDRKTELFEDLVRQFATERDPESRKNAELIYDQVLDTLLTGIQQNFGRDEINYALDMVTLSEKLATETEFERIIREKQDLEGRLKEAMRQRVEDEMRARRGRMTFEELLKSVHEIDFKEEQRKQQDVLRRFVENKGYMDQHGDGFMGLLRQTQSYMGPYALKMANDFLKNQEVEKKQRHEKMSFVKMEYFLYAVSEAHRCVVDLRMMEARINDMHTEFEIAHRELANVGGGNVIIPGLFKSKDQQQSYDEKQRAFDSIKARMEQLKYQVSMKENELVIIFRELMSWDFHVPDFYFDKDLMLDRKRQEQLQETYQMPLRTFWRPIYFDAIQETDILHPTFTRVARDFSQLSREQQAELEQHFSESERAHYPRQGVLVSCLRPYEVKAQADFMKFDKFFSKGEWMEQQELNRIKETITLKLSKTLRDHGANFRATTSQPSPSY